MQSSPSISNIQQELLKLYSSNIAEGDLLNVRRLLAKYFATKAIDEADKIWEQKGLDNNMMDQWLNEENNVNDKSSH